MDLPLDDYMEGTRRMARRAFVRYRGELPDEFMQLGLNDWEDDSGEASEEASDDESGFETAGENPHEQEGEASNSTENRRTRTAMR